MSVTYLAKNGNTYCKGSKGRNKICHFFVGSAIRRHWPGEKMFYYECGACGFIHLTKTKKGRKFRRLPAYP